jgi:hypothetical protein
MMKRISMVCAAVLPAVAAAQATQQTSQFASGVDVVNVRDGHGYVDNINAASEFRHLYLLCPRTRLGDQRRRHDYATSDTERNWTKGRTEPVASVWPGIVEFPRMRSPSGADDARRREGL